MTLALLVLLLQPSASPADAAHLFAVGSALVAEGDTAGAVAAWEGAAETGYASAEVSYNLGTLALARGEVGRARLHLERAARLAPADQAVMRNLALARQAAGEPPQGRGAAVWARARAALPPLLMVTVALGLAFAALGAVLAGRRRLGAAVGLAAALAVAAAGVSVWQSTRPLGVAIADVAVTASPSPTGELVARLREGEAVAVGTEADGWRAVRVGRARGFVRAAAVEPL